MSEDRLESIFGQTGSLSRVLAPAYEWRPQQGEMARRVARALDYGGVLLVEAPTGVGKSLAYLVPGVLWAISNGKPCVISTYTKQLQDQIIEKDLPRLQRLIDRSLRVAVLKGRSSYLCRQRWDLFVDEASGTTEGERLIRLLTAWVDTTETGDLSEAPALTGRDRVHLSQIASDARFCAHHRCRPETGCFYKKSRKTAKEAHLLIVNHALLVTDLFHERGGIPAFDALIVDEAHHLPRVAADPLSFSVSERTFESILKGLGGRGEPGATDDLRRVVKSLAGPDQRRRLLDRIRAGEEETSAQIASARAFWTELMARPDFPRPGASRRYSPSDVPPVPESGVGLCLSLREHLAHLGELVAESTDLHEAAGALTGTGRAAPLETLALAEATRRLERAGEVVAHFEELLSPTDRHRVYWVEHSDGYAALRTVPLAVGKPLQERLFQQKQAVVLASATLSVQDSFTHAAESLGLREGRYDSVTLPSPFDFSQQVRAFVHTRIPDPNQPGFHEELARGIVELVRTLEKKTMVLFTAHETLRRVADLLEEPLSARGIPLLAQGVGMGRRSLRDRFEREDLAVLLGAASFWEGVDFPGQDLEILVMARLPFLVPSDPVVEARGERAEAEGRDPFNDYYLPEALLRFRQGFGRLVRRRADRGIFIVGDPRLHQRGYGRQFEHAIGVSCTEAASWDEIVSAGQSWFAGGTAR